jgi:hypothetical protein
MRDVTAAPPAMTEAPPWEDEKAVRAWAIATLRSEERVEIDAARQGPHKWNEDWARWQKRAFELAEEGDFDALIQFVAFSPNLGSITFEQRKNSDLCGRRENPPAQGTTEEVAAALCAARGH